MTRSPFKEKYTLYAIMGRALRAMMLIDTPVSLINEHNTGNFLPALTGSQQDILYLPDGIGVLSGMEWDLLPYLTVHLFLILKANFQAPGKPFGSRRRVRARYNIRRLSRNRDRFRRAVSSVMFRMQEKGWDLELWNYQAMCG